MVEVASSMKTKRPFFIVGAPRSGTTLLQAMLMSKPGIYIPPETKFWGLTKGRERKHGRIDQPEGYRRSVDAVLTLIREDKIPIDPELLEKEWSDTPRDYGPMFDVLLSNIQASQPNCHRIGEKTPSHLKFVPELLETFPDGKVITIIRDGRDVAVSQNQAWGGNIFSSAMGWRRDQKLHETYKQGFSPEQYTSVLYEDLVTNTENELRRLCDFLEEPFEEVMLQPQARGKTGFADREKHKLRTLEPVTNSRIGRYKNSLSSSHIALFQLIARKQLKALGYPLHPVSGLQGIPPAMRMVPQTLLERARPSR